MKLLLILTLLNFTRYLSGYHEVVYDIISPRGVADIPAYSNSSYVQKIIEDRGTIKRIMVKTGNNPFSSPFKNPSIDYKRFLLPEKDIPSDSPEIKSLSKKVLKGAKTDWEKLERAVNFAMDYLDYAVDVPQDVFSVLRQKKGSCVGYSRLVIALLRAGGVPARYVFGYLPPGYDWGPSKEYWGVKTSGGGYHAWVESYIKGAGWVFSDAQHSKGFVDPFHIFLGAEGGPGEVARIKGGEIDVDKGVTFSIVKEISTFEPVGEDSNPLENLLSLPPPDFKPSPRLKVIVLDRKTRKPIKGAEVVRWSGDKGMVFKTSEKGEAMIVLKNNSYRISVRAEGKAEEILEGNVPGHSKRVVKLFLERGFSIRGKVRTGTNKRPDGKVILWEGMKGRVFPFEKGFFEIGHLRKGTYSISVKVNGFPEKTFTVHLDKKTKPLEIEF